MGLMTKVEGIVGAPMEKFFHNRKGFQPVDLNRMALRAMESGTKVGFNQRFAPNHFTVGLNPKDHKDLKAFIPTIRSDILGQLRGIVEERKYHLAGALAVELMPDKAVEFGKPQVSAHMQGEDEPASVVAYKTCDQGKGASSQTASADFATGARNVPDDQPPQAGATDQVAIDDHEISDVEKPFVLGGMDSATTPDAACDVSRLCHADSAVDAELVSDPETAGADDRRKPPPATAERLAAIERRLANLEALVCGAAPARGTGSNIPMIAWQPWPGDSGVGERPSDSSNVFKVNREMPGVELRFGNAGVALTNAHMVRSVTVNNALNQRQVLSKGDILRIGHLVLRVEDVP